MSKIKLTQIKSSAGKNKVFRANLIGLGLNKVSKDVVIEDTPSNRGMIFKVRHMVKTEIVK